MSDEQPEVRWAPIEPKPKNRGRIWLIVGIGVAALAIVGALLFFLLPRGDAPEPGASGSPGPSSSPTPSDAATQIPGTPTSPEPSAAPEVTPPAPVDPTIDAFREQVSGWLTDAPRGLDIVAGASGDEALSVIDALQQDVQRLSDARPPSSIDPQWRKGVGDYALRLEELRSAVSSSSNTAGAVEAARTAVQNLRSVVGL